MEQIDLHDIYEQIYVPFWHRAWCKYFFIIIGLVLVIISIGYYWLIYRSRKQQTSWDRALRDLEQLSGYAVKKYNKLLYFDLISLIKRYVMDRYIDGKLGVTDEELSAILYNTDFTEQQSNTLREIIARAQTIKFADQAATQEQFMIDCQQCVSLVKATIPQK